MNQSQVAATHELRSAGKAAKIVLAADRSRLAPDWDNVSCVTARVVDENGVVVPSAGDPIQFHLAGPGIIAAVDSAGNSSHEPFQVSERRAGQGPCFAIVKATAAAGRITLAASSPGLTPAKIAIEAVKR